MAIGFEDGITVAHILGSANEMYTIGAVGKAALAVNGAATSGTVTLLATLSAISTTGEAIGIWLNDYDFVLNANAAIAATTQSGSAYAVSHAKLKFATASTVATITATSTTGKSALLYNTTATAPFSTAATLTVSTESGMAMGVYVTGAFSYSVDGAYVLHADATDDGGCAYGAYVSGGSLTVGANLSATGPAAFGAYIEEGGILTPQASARFTATATQNAACGIYVQSGEMDGSAVFTVTATSPLTAYGVYNSDTVWSLYASVTASATDTDGIAYGVFNNGTLLSLYGTVTVHASGIGYGLYNGGTVNSLRSPLTVNAAANAYGVYVVGGCISATVSGFGTTVVSTGADAYGIYVGGGQVGSFGLSGSMRYGVITATAEGGIAYGLYVASGVMYVHGEELYYKAAVPSTGITICEGYSEVQKSEADAVYPLYHYLTAASYTITFVTNGGAGVSQYTYKVDASVYLPTTTRDGADFAGWFYDSGLSSAATLTKMPNYNLTLYAGWTVTVTFVDQTGGTTIAPVTGFIGASVPVDAPVRSGYNFVGWFAASDLTGDAYVLDYFPEAHLTLYVKWEAKKVTITFVTNGGSEIAPVTGQVGGWISVDDPMRPGYYFDGWYLDAGLSQRYYISTFPENDLTLYARWEVTLCLILLGDYTACTVRLNFGDVNGDGVLGDGEYQEYVFPADTFYIEDTSEWWIYSALPDYLGQLLGMTQPMRVKGWFTEPAGGTAVNLASGIGTWGVEPVDGVINLYPQLVPLENAVCVTDMWLEADMVDFGQTDFQMIFTDDLSAEVKGVQGGYRYYTYKSFRRGTHKVLFAAYDTGVYATVVRYGLDGSIVETVFDGEMPIPSVDLASLTHEIHMEEGEVLEFRVYISDAEKTEDVTFVVGACLPNVSTLTSVEELFVMYNVDDYVIYSAAMGTVMLPVNGTPGFDGVSGWKYKVNGVPSSETLTAITPTLLENIDIWQDMGGLCLLQLYPYSSDQLMGFVATITAGRYFNPGVLLDSEQQLNAVIRDNGGLTFTFLWEGLLANTPTLPPTYGLTTLCFNQGLPAGTTVTIIDLSSLLTMQGDDLPTFGYYAYVVGEGEAGVTELDLNRFTAFGGGGTFAGFSSVMIINVSFAGAASAPSSGKIWIKLDGTRTDAELSYTVKTTTQTPFGSVTIEPGESFGGTLPLPEMAGQGYNEDDLVLLLLRLAENDGTPVALPATIQLTGTGVFQYHDFAGAVVGTVASLADGGTYVGMLDISALRYHNFSGKLYYEVVVVPADTDLTAFSCFGVESSVHTRYAVSLTVSDAPSLSFAEPEGTAQQGESITLSVYATDQSNSELELYVYQTVEGKMQYTRACATLLEGISVDQYGHATFDDGSTLTCGEFTLTLRAVADDGSPGATAGVYFLVVNLNGNYAVYTLTVTE